MENIAAGNPKQSPFSYGYETLPAGAAEMEQYVDFVPLKAREAGSGEEVWFAATQFQTEFEYGITDRLELGLYLTLAPPAGERYAGAATLPYGNGLKQRLRYRFAEQGQWPIDVSLYGEVVENTREIELEGKILLERRFGLLRTVVNLWAEHEFYYDGEKEWVLHPTAAMSYQATPGFQPGIEAWMRAEFADENPRPFNAGPHVYIGPTFLAILGRIWWSTGIYFRVTDTGRTTIPGDAFGPLWMRMIIGVSL